MHVLVIWVIIYVMMYVMLLCSHVNVCVELCLHCYSVNDVFIGGIKLTLQFNSSFHCA